jgi:hypothetical protein
MMLLSFIFDGNKMRILFLFCHLQSGLNIKWTHIKLVVFIVKKICTWFLDG